MMEAPTSPALAAVHGSSRKRPLEVGRPEFMAREDGAYHVLEMPKKHRCGYVAANQRRRARSHFLTSNVNTAANDDSGVGGEKKKRALELDEPEFVAEESGGAYDISDMPKKYKFEAAADPDRSSSPLANALDAEHARSLARLFRRLSVTSKYIQELKAMAAARRN